MQNSLESVQLPLGEILLKANQKIESVYFLTQEIGLIGKEGMVGTPQFLGDGILGSSRAEVQVKGVALRIDATALRIEYNRSELLQKLILQYSLSLFNQVSQCAACNNHHTVKQRTARWLIMLDERRLKEEKVSMTQQLLSKMLGVRRTGVSAIAKELQQHGIIDYHRACECYQIVRI